MQMHHDIGNHVQCGKKPFGCRPLPDFAQDGYRVAPFKSQNMALLLYHRRRSGNGGGSGGSGRGGWDRAAADMNPILTQNPHHRHRLSGDRKNGISRGNMRVKDYFAYKKS